MTSEFINKWFSLSDHQKFDFIERSVLIHDSKGNTFPLVLAPFQKEWLSQGPLFTDFRNLSHFTNRIALKCRNVGASYIMIALESVLTGYIYPKVTIPFIAPTEDQTKVLIESCISLITDLRFDVALKGGIKGQTKSEINFLNGSKIKAFSSNPRGMRGTRALTVYCDEMAHLERDQEVYDAVNYFIAGGGQLNILSTPFGKQNLYWRIWSDRKSYTNWHRLDIKAFDGDIDINRSLKEQIASGTIKPIIPWLNIDKVEADRKGDSHNGYRNFMQEMLGIPLEEVSSVISTELLNTVTKDYFVLEGRDPMSNQVFGVGVDYGASNNMTAAVTGVFESGRLVVCNTSQFSGNVDVQINNIVEYTNRFSHDYYFGDATGLGGHAQPLYSKILTPNGWVTMGSIKKGDIICSYKGGKQIVNEVYPQGVKDIYEVVFSDDTVVECTGDHLWESWKTEDGVKSLKPRTTIEIKNIIENTKNRVSTPLPSRIQMKHKDVTIDPYILGALIGDGGMSSHNITFTSPDKFIIEKIRSKLPNDMDIKKHKSNEYGYQIKMKIKSIKGIRYANPNKLKLNLEKLGLMKKIDRTKFIPKCYLYNDINTRLEVLCGLMDTDGYVDSRGHMSYTTVSYRLAEDFLILIRSLGCKGKISKKMGKWTYKGVKKESLQYNIHFNCENKEGMVSLPKKLNRIRNNKQKLGNRIISVKLIKKSLSQCINVTDGLYITDNYKVTHNSFQDVLSARDVKVGMIVGVDYAKKDIATRFGSKMNNKEFMVNRALELFARGKIIVPHNFRELRLQILGVKKYVYDNHIKYSGKDSLTKNDDLAMAFFQLVLAYDYHYGIGDLESVSSSNADWFNRESKPKFKKAQYFEGGSVKGLEIPRSNGGFGKFG